MPSHLSRRAFLTTAGVVPLARQAWAQPTAGSPHADVVVVGGDAAAMSAVYRLTRTPGLRVTLVTDRGPSAVATAPTTSPGLMPPFVRGHQVCFDSWRDMGNPGWGYADVLPSFKRLERYEAGASEYRGGDGPLSVVHCWDPHALHPTFLRAAVSGGFQQDSRHDFNGPRSQSFAGYYQKRLLDDGPHTLEAAFLDPARKAGLTVVGDAVVVRVVVEQGRAVGVEIARGANRELLRAERGVLLAASPARAAQLLMLSGIGPADQLRASGVAIVADRQGVGANLHDQPRIAVRWQALPPALNLPESSVTVGMFTVSLNASPPDLQWDFVDPRGSGGPTLGVDVTLVQPKARGTVRLRSADPTAAPIVEVNALSDDADVAALVQGVRLARLAFESPQLDRMRGMEAPPSAAAQSPAELQALVRREARVLGHAAGTCRMGRATDPRSVVDATLAVHGVAGLRVAGAAVMPVVVNAPPEAASLMLGDRAAEFVLAAR
jgi:choline dehydrogenase